jgi:hypothetical protein
LNFELYDDPLLHLSFFPKLVETLLCKLRHGVTDAPGIPIAEVRTAFRNQIEQAVTVFRAKLHAIAQDEIEYILKNSQFSDEK